MDYLRDPASIYARSFAIIREESDLSALPPDMRDIAIRIVHACGMVDVARDLVVTPDFLEAANAALRKGKPIFTDVEMVRHGIVPRFVPRGLEIICRLNDSRAREIGKLQATTRSAAAVELWRPEIEGALVAIGNAPTALFALLEKIDAGWPRPAALIAFPVGFVGAAESKQELIANPRGIPFITLPGRRGGSAMAAATVNGLLEGLAR
jgi:precorrin-8X/cobalt-precorrin-8 methylmutase